MPNSQLFNELKKGKLYIISGKPKVGKTSFAIHLYEQLCKDKNLQDNSYGIISYSIKNNFIKGFEDMELLNVVTDYQLLNSSSSILFFDIKIKPELQNQYYSDKEIWHTFLKAFREVMTNDAAGVVLILSIPFEDEKTNEQTTEEDINSLLYYFSEADKIFLLDRPEYYDEAKGEQFGTTYLYNIDVKSKKVAQIHFKADFKKFMFELL